MRLENYFAKAKQIARKTNPRVLPAIIDFEKISIDHARGKTSEKIALDELRFACAKNGLNPGLIDQCFFEAQAIKMRSGIITPMIDFNQQKRGVQRRPDFLAALFGPKKGPQIKVTNGKPIFSYTPPKIVAPFSQQKNNRPKGKAPGVLMDFFQKGKGLELRPIKLGAQQPSHPKQAKGKRRPLINIKFPGIKIGGFR